MCLNDQRCSYFSLQFVLKLLDDHLVMSLPPLRQFVADLGFPSAPGMIKHPCICLFELYLSKFQQISQPVYFNLALIFLSVQVFLRFLLYLVFLAKFSRSFDAQQSPQLKLLLICQSIFVICFLLLLLQSHYCIVEILAWQS